jgi:predicted aspartyl protease
VPSVRFDPKATFVRVPARIVGPKGVEWLGLALDTGSSRTVISEHVALRTGFNLLTAPSVRIATASGIVEARVVTLRQIFALGETADEFQVLVLPLPAQLRSDGLLGLDFLKRRNLFCNFDKGILLTLPFSRSFLHRLALSAQIFSAL